MGFMITSELRANTLGLDGPVAILHDAANRLEIWPALGFNAYRWQVAGQELLYRSPQFFEENRPTRSGIPILFPFPNRIRDGQYSWAGKPYQLPIGDPAKKNAIHGFAVKKPWRVIDQGADAASAWITGEFHGAADAPETLALWPADYRLRLTYRLLDHRLRVEATVDNPDTKPLPFGLGYHPYFAIAPLGGPDAIVTIGAEKMWELVENLPTGRILNVDAPRDLRRGQSYASLQLDDIVTGIIPSAREEHSALSRVAMIQHPEGSRLLTLWATADFRELVLFTPPHREAMCLEPYTCTTDAINLAQQGIDAGLRILRPGERWEGVIEVRLT